MTTPNSQASAKIYQFPTKARIVSARGDVSGSTRAAPSVPPVIYGSGWYHDMAIQDAQRPGKR
jgi:hypothetical protein